MSPSTKTWSMRALGGAVLIGVMFLFWNTFFSNALSVERVGPRPKAGGTVVVLLHGYGASGSDLVGWAHELSGSLPQVTFLMPAGPHPVGFMGRSWVPDFSAPTEQEFRARQTAEAEATRRQLWEVIERAHGQGVACSDIWIGGFSLGGRMALEVALRSPPDCHLGGLLVFSGGGLNFVPDPPADAVPPLKALVTHGTSDNVVAFGRGRGTAQLLANGHHEVHWLAFPGGHELPQAVTNGIVSMLRGEPVGELISAP